MPNILNPNLRNLSMLYCNVSTRSTSGGSAIFFFNSFPRFVITCLQPTPKRTICPSLSAAMSTIFWKLLSGYTQDPSRSRKTCWPPSTRTRIDGGLGGLASQQNQTLALGNFSIGIHHFHNFFKQKAKNYFSHKLVKNTSNIDISTIFWKLWSGSTRRTHPFF